MPKLPHHSETNSTRAKARSRRNLNLVIWWGIALMLVFALVIGGSWLLIIVIAIIAVMLISNTLIVVRGDGAETYAIAPGALKAGEDISVPATRAPDRRESGRRRGVLEFRNSQLSFTVGEQLGRNAKKDELVDQTIFSLFPKQIYLGPRPTWRRPQLIVRSDNTTHVIEFTMPNDLGAGMVGAVVAAEWWQQLQDLGAKLSPSA